MRTESQNIPNMPWRHMWMSPKKNANAAASNSSLFYPIAFPPSKQNDKIAATRTATQFEFRLKSEVRGGLIRRNGELWLIYIDILKGGSLKRFICMNSYDFFVFCMGLTLAYRLEQKKLPAYFLLRYLLVTSLSFYVWRRLWSRDRPKPKFWLLAEA